MDCPHTKNICDDDDIWCKLNGCFLEILARPVPNKEPKQSEPDQPTHQPTEQEERYDQLAW